MIQREFGCIHHPEDHGQATEFNARELERSDIAGGAILPKQPPASAREEMWMMRQSGVIAAGFSPARHAHFVHGRPVVVPRISSMGLASDLMYFNSRVYDDVMLALILVWCVH